MYKRQEIRFQRAKPGDTKKVFVWEPEGKDTKEDIQIFEDDDQIISFVSLYQPKILSKAEEIAKRRFLARFTPVELIGGIIAILVTSTTLFAVVYQLLHEREFKLPELWALVSVIAGFYFGRAIGDQVPRDTQKS